MYSWFTASNQLNLSVAAFFYPDSASASEVGGGDTRNSTANATAVAAQLMIRTFVA
jgi:hypothetical protein